jgi:nitric-oxide synthase
MMAQKDPAAAAAQKYKPIQSAVPGTTLGPIQINAFLGGGVSHFISYAYLSARYAFSICTVSL